jgi:hypothetical protein
MDLFGTKKCFRNADGSLWLEINVCHVVGECNGTRGGTRMGGGGLVARKEFGQLIDSMGLGRGKLATMHRKHYPK